MNIENKLFSTIENTISNYDTIDSFDRETVFSELLNFSKPASNQVDLFKMYFVFNKYKKILHSLRVGDIVLAEYNLKYLTDKNITYSNKLSEIAMNSLYFPVIAYYFFKKQDYAKAQTNIEKSYIEFDTLFEMGYKNVIFNFVEQKINEFRILYKKGENVKAIFLIKSLFQNIVSENNFYHFKINFKEVCLNNDELLSYINYILDICNTYILIEKDQIKIENNDALTFIENINQILLEKKDSIYCDLKLNFRALKKLYSNNNESFLIFASENFNKTLNKNTSCSISYIFYKTLLNTIQNDVTLYDKSIQIFKSKEKAESYKCFVEKLLQDEKIKACSF
jgi:hypothetical protein